MTPWAGVLVLVYGHIGHTVKMHHFFKKNFIYSQTSIRQTKYLVMITNEGSTKIVNFMTPWEGVLVLGCGHINHTVKINYFFQNVFLYSEAWFRQTWCKLMLTHEVFWISWLLGQGHITHENVMFLFFSILGH